MKGHNKPPVEISAEDAAFLLEMLERDFGQALALLGRPDCPRPTAEKLVGLMDRIKPLRAKIKQALEG